MHNFFCVAVVRVGLVAVLSSLTAGSVVLRAQTPPRVLFLSKSSGFEHSAIRLGEDETSHVDRVLRKLAGENGLELLTTKDAGLINSKDLESFDVVIFYTTGDLTQEGRGDGHPAMKATGVEDLRRWVEKGGGFVGYHSASDTFHGSQGTVTPYIELVGGEFQTHGRQFTGTVKVADTGHPTMAHVPESWHVLDEWYVFKNLNRDKMHVLALLDPGPEAEKQALYRRPSYPIIWCRALGEGRVYYNAMGHREDVWDNAVFQSSVLDALDWAMGKGEARADPNYHRLVEEGQGQDGQGQDGRDGRRDE